MFFMFLTLTVFCVATEPLPTRASDEYRYVYSEEPTSFNYLNNGSVNNVQHVANFIDGLLEHDRYGILRPALAESWSVNDDYTVWTFNIRGGVPWVDADGAPRAEVKAQDWVDAMRYMLDNQSALTYLIDGVIKNAGAYLRGGIKDFSMVGIRAVSDYVLEYTLEKPIPYFASMLTYSAYYPVNGEFLRAKGLDFGKVDRRGILYNGAYVLANYTHGAEIEYEANHEYWDRAHVAIKHVKYAYFDGMDVGALFDAFEAGACIATPVDTANAVLFARAQAEYGASLFRTGQDLSTFVYIFNYNRRAYASPTGASVGKSPKSERARADTRRAVLNREFRKAIFFGLDRTTLLARRDGAMNGNFALRNSYTAPDLCFDRTGVDYVHYVEDALERRDPADFPSDFGIDDARDPYYSPDRARAYMLKAKKELGEQGVVFPIELDVAVDTAYSKGMKMATVLKSGLEEVFGVDTLLVNIVGMDADAYDASTAYAETGAQCNYDMGITGWSAEYADPSTFLQTLEPVNGELLTALGLDFPPGSGEQKEASTIGLYDYAAKLDAGRDEFRDQNRRLALFAEAEAQLLDDAVILPFMSFGGTLQLSRVIPYTCPYAAYGADAYKLKGVIVSDTVVSLDEREAYRREWENSRRAAYEQMRTPPPPAP